jgi:hypothetical protein
MVVKVVGGFLVLCARPGMKQWQIRRHTYLCPSSSAARRVLRAPGWSPSGVCCIEKNKEVDRMRLEVLTKEIRLAAADLANSAGI